MSETLTVTDNRTGKTYEVPIEDGTVRAMAFRRDEGRRGRLRPHDLRPGVHEHRVDARRPSRSSTATRASSSTAATPSSSSPRSRATSRSRTCSSTASCRRRSELQAWTDEITIHTFVHENVKKFMEGFRYDAHPMGMLCGSVGALSTFYPDANEIQDPENRHIQTIRLIAKMPTLAAFAYRHTQGQPYVYPDNDLSYSGNFLNMMYKMTELKYEPDPRLERALDILFILHADHEQNASTSAVRSVGSTQVDPYSALAAGVAALYGPLHGGANEAVLRMLKRIETTDNIQDFIEGVKNGDERLMGFGHRVYKNFDPRATIIKKAVEDVFEVTGQEPAARHRHRAREDRARGRLLRRPQALPERRLLLGPHLRGARPAGRDVPGHVRHRAHVGLDRAVARARRRQGAEDRAAAPDLHRRPRARLRAGRPAVVDHSDRTARAGLMMRPAHAPAAPLPPHHGPTTRAVSPTGLQRLSPESRHKRFLMPKPRFSSSELRYLTEIDGFDHVAIVAVSAEDPDVFYGVARFVRLREDPRPPRRRSSSPTRSRARASGASSAAGWPTRRASAASSASPRRCSATTRPRTRSSRRSPSG